MFTLFKDYKKITVHLDNYNIDIKLKKVLSEDRTFLTGGRALSMFCDSIFNKQIEYGDTDIVFIESDPAVPDMYMWGISMQLEKISEIIGAHKDLDINKEDAYKHLMKEGNLDIKGFKEGTFIKANNMFHAVRYLESYDLDVCKIVCFVSGDNELTFMIHNKALDNLLKEDLTYEINPNAKEDTINRVKKYKNRLGFK